MDFKALLLNESAGNQKMSPSDNRRGNADNGQYLQPEIDGARQRRESDTESGFEEGHMSKSLLEDGLSETPSIEDLRIENLLAELQSVAVHWSSLRNVTNCSCALPFEQYTKKVSGLVCYAILGWSLQKQLRQNFNLCHKSELDKK